MSDWVAMPPTLVTSRLTLGPWREDDIAPYSTMVFQRDARAAAAPRDGHPTREELVAEIRATQCALSDTGIALLAVRVDDVFVGYAGLTVGQASHDEPEIAYELLREFHGLGYATEAARAIVAAAVDTGRDRLWATVRTWNYASLRVLTKIAFTDSGRVSTDGFGDSAWWTRPLSSSTT